MVKDRSHPTPSRKRWEGILIENNNQDSCENKEERKENSRETSNGKTSKKGKYGIRRKIDFEKRNKVHRIIENIEEMDLEFLLLNTLTITAEKVQMFINDFLKGDSFTSIFCFTETKVESLNFKPVGIKKKILNKE